MFYLQLGMLPLESEGHYKLGLVPTPQAVSLIIQLDLKSS